MSHKNRKTIECLTCGKDRLNYGNGRCNPCSRKYKRQTRPRFYLGTCYSEMKRRVTKFDKDRPNYYGLNICDVDEFKNTFEKDPAFLKLYKKWQKNNFERKFAPSIDRIDNTKGYTLDNLQFTSHFENTGKDKRNLCWARKCGKSNIHSFESQTKLANFLNCSPACVCKKLKSGREEELKGYIIWR